MENPRLFEPVKFDLSQSGDSPHLVMSSQSAGEEIASGTDVHVGLLVFDEEEDDAPEKIEKGKWKLHNTK